MSDVFYIAGIVLVLVALAISFVGIRSEKFPPSKGVMLGALSAVILLVLATTTYAVVLSKEEQDERNEELAMEAEEEAAAAEEEAAENPVPEGSPDEQAPVAPDQGPPETKGAPLELSSPADGNLVFEPGSLQAEAGTLTIDYTNPSPVPHNIALEGGGEVLGEGPTVTDGDVSSLEADLEPGEYIYYCAVPGHRESGMEGTLTVN